MYWKILNTLELELCLLWVKDCGEHTAEQNVRWYNIQ